MKVINQFKEHYYTANYDKSDLFCPNCGKQEVWEEQGMGDYYLGVTYICLACENIHSLDHTCCKADENDILIVKQLKEQKTAIPRGRPGG